MRIVASLMPKDVHIAPQPFDDLTDEELATYIATIQRYLDAGGSELIELTPTTIEGEHLVLPTTEEP